MSVRSRPLLSASAALAAAILAALLISPATARADGLFDGIKQMGAAAMSITNYSNDYTQEDLANADQGPTILESCNQTPDPAACQQIYGGGQLGSSGDLQKLKGAFGGLGGLGGGSN